MVEASLFEIMSDYASLNQNDVVLDIGAGLGFLTRFLAGKCKCVLAVELDAQLAEVLRGHCEGLPNVQVIEGDVLKVQFPRFNKVVSIPPYHISSRLLLWLFEKDFDCAILIFQKEFAKKLVASIGSEDYGWLTVFTYYHVEVELLDVVPKLMFYPEPKVDSIIVRLKPRKPSPFQVKNKMAFKRMLQLLFTQRNRKVSNAVLPFIKEMRKVKVEKAGKVAKALPFSERRVRELAPEDFGVLANVLWK